MCVLAAFFSGDRSICAMHADQIDKIFTPGPTIGSFLAPFVGSFHGDFFGAISLRALGPALWTTFPYHFLNFCNFHLQTTYSLHRFTII